MFRKAILGILFVSAFVVAASSAQAGKVDLTTYYPAPNGEYKDLQASTKLKVPVKTVTNDPTGIAATKEGEIWVQP